jgi:hypothetical protein
MLLFVTRAATPTRSRKFHTAATPNYPVAGHKFPGNTLSYKQLTHLRNSSSV